MSYNMNFISDVHRYVDKENGEFFKNTEIQDTEQSTPDNDTRKLFAIDSMHRPTIDRLD